MFSFLIKYLVDSGKTFSELEQFQADAGMISLLLHYLTDFSFIDLTHLSGNMCTHILAPSHVVHDVGPSGLHVAIISERNDVEKN